MALYLTNIAAMQANRHLYNSTMALNVSYQRLASGKRINSAKDDPAGLQIANRMTSQINGLKQASRNTSDGLAFAQTYEGALDETTNMLQKIRTLAVQAATGTVTKEDREAIKKEIDQLGEEITRIAEQTTYGGKTILLGTKSEMLDNGKMTIQVGANAGDTITMDLSQSFTLQDIYDGTLGKVNGGTVVDGGKFKLDSADDASNIIGAVDEMLGVVSSKRAELGAMQVRFESVLRLNGTMTINMSDARSRIEDTDYAEESANLMRNQILQQTSVAMLMQANARNNIILQLLGGI